MDFTVNNTGYAGNYGNSLNTVNTQNNLSGLRINNNNYLVLRQLGEGASSRVLQVICLQSNTIMAVKQVSLKGADEQTKKAFQDEIKFLEKLSGNPYIVQLYNYQLINDHIYLVLEYGSTDLANLIQSRKSQNGGLGIYEILYLWEKMLHAVNTIHQNEIIHRDLKPANFVFVEGQLKLIDFGISNSIPSDATSIIKETWCGTPNYMAPEAIMDMSGVYNPEDRQFKIRRKTDVWSLGCILYSMMYGRTPFQHIDPRFKLNAIIDPHHKIDFPGFTLNFGPNLRNIVQNCLQRDPKNRATVEQLLEFL